MVVVRGDRERRRRLCDDCDEELGEIFVALPALGVVLCPRCGSTIGRRLQAEAAEAFEMELENLFGQKKRRL